MFVSISHLSFSLVKPNRAVYREVKADEAGGWGSQYENVPVCEYVKCNTTIVYCSV